jgi:hypothetical protein
MTAKPELPRRHVAVTVASAALAALIGIGVLGGVTGLFQRDGLPFEQLVAAEQACADRAYLSERDACVRAWVAAAGFERFASRATPPMR